MGTENIAELRERLLRNYDVQELIRTRAFELYTLRGGQPGGEAHDWFQAENEVLARLIEQQPRGSASPGSRETAPESAGTTKRGATKSAKPRKRKEAGTPAKRASKKPASSSTKPRRKQE